MMLRDALNDIEIKRNWLDPPNWAGERRGRFHTASELTLTCRSTGDLLALLYCPGVMRGWQVYTHNGTFYSRISNMKTAVSWALNEVKKP